MIKAVYLGDNSDATNTNLEYIKKYGNIECSVFSEPDEALEYLETNPESLVLFEDGCLGLDFDEFSQRLKKLGLGGAFVVITAEDDCNVISDMYRNGISAVLVKPFDYDVFSVAVDYYREHLNAVAAGEITSNFWVPLSRIFTRKDSDLANLLLEALKKEDASAASLSKKIRRPVFLVQQCLNELVLSRSVVSYIKAADGETPERVFSCNCKEPQVSRPSNN